MRLRPSTRLFVRALEERLTPTFANGVGYALPANVQSVSTADFDGDSKIDLLTGSSGGVSTLKNNGNGTFQNAVNMMTGGGIARDVKGIDLTGDGRPEIVVANDGSNAIAVLKNNGDGTFQAPQSYATGITPRGVIGGDFNGDDKQDVAVGRDGGIDVYFGNGTGGLGARAPYTGVTSTQIMHRIGAADFNGDDKKAE